jgi:hypothetical protein
MKTIPEQFTESGFTHRQLVREGRVAIFERQHANASLPHFEVVVIDSHNGYEIAGVQCPPAEMYPGAKQWGKKGWTFTDHSQAVDKFETLKAHHARALSL